MIFQHKDWPLWLLIGAFFVAAVFIYPHLPDQVPGHWNINGEVDNYVSKEFGAFFPPSLALVIYLLMLIGPKIDPKGANFQKYLKVWNLFRWVMVLFMMVVGLITWAVALGYEVNVGKTIGVLTALLFIGLGNYLPKIQYKNYTFGIRTPWTLDNEVVWRETHRWVGKYLVLGGIAALIGVIIDEKVGFYLLMAGIFLPFLGALVYSYLKYNELKD